MAYLVLAYPELSKKDYELIQDFRRENDELYYKVVEPHFTIVFPVFDITEKDFITEVREKIKGVKSFSFSLRCATINKDAFSNYYHVFLVPDEGYSNIVKIHDRLYSGLLKDNHRLDVDFIPHIGIANSVDKYKCKRLVDYWNSKEFEINGTISKITIIKYENNIVTNIEDIRLI
ncbi:MAG: 2'-5' RNA ligase family protein [Brevinematia bacterium]